MAIVTAGRLLIKTVGLLSGSHSGTIFTLINPRHACARRVSSFPVCVCPFSLFCLLTLLGIQREVSATTAQKMQ